MLYTRSESYQKQRKSPKAFTLELGGGRWIRTTEGIASRLTVCPLWPLGNSPIFIGCSGWSWWTDSNPRPADYKSAALPTELHQRVLSSARLIYQTFILMSTINIRFFRLFSGRGQPSARKAKTAARTASGPRETRPGRSGRKNVRNADQRLSQIMSAVRSAGETPEMRDACPRLAGWIRDSFSQASVRTPGTE